MSNYHRNKYTWLILPISLLLFCKQSKKAFWSFIQATFWGCAGAALDSTGAAGAGAASLLLPPKEFATAPTARWAIALPKFKLKN